MAQVQRYLETSELYASPPQPRPQLLYDLCSSAALIPEVSLAHNLYMSFEEQIPVSKPQYHMDSVAGGIMSTHTGLLSQHATSDDLTRWTGLPYEPQTDTLMLANSDLLYSHVARQHPLSKTEGLNGSLFWRVSGMNDMASSPGADLLLSPVSPFSDTKDTYSPGPDYSPIMPSCSAMSHAVPTGTTRTLSSPSFLPLTPQSCLEQLPNADVHHHDLGIPMGSVVPYRVTSAIFDEQTDNVSRFGSEHSYEHLPDGSPVTASWYPPGYMSAHVATAQDAASQQAPFDNRPKSLTLTLGQKARQQQTSWSNKSDVPAQSHFQTRFVTPNTDKQRAQRAKDDEMLLQMKQDGYTYRDICKALGRKVAESTLRGRYRTLTKARKDRVRSPKWTEADIALLKRYVQEEFDKLDVTQPSLQRRKKPDKVSWAKIVELVATSGGTYKFGAATAKKKWFEVTRAAPLRPSRRRSRA